MLPHPEISGDKRKTTRSPWCYLCAASKASRRLPVLWIGTSLGRYFNVSGPETLLTREEVMTKLLRIRAVVSTAAEVLRNNSQMFGMNANARVITPLRDSLRKSFVDSDPNTT